MANREVSNGAGFHSSDPSPSWSGQRDLEIGVWNPSLSGSGSNSAISAIPVPGVGYQQSNSNPHLYVQGDINSDWRNVLPGSSSALPQQPPYYTPSPPNSYSPQSGYTGQMMTPVSNTIPQYQSSGHNDMVQTLQSYTDSTQNFYRQQPSLGEQSAPPYAQPYQNLSAQSQAGVVPMQYPSPNTGQGDAYSSPQTQTHNWSSEPQAASFNSNPHCGSFSTSGGFKNPLMDDSDKEPGDSTLNLIRNMHIEGEKAQREMQEKNFRYPRILSKASMAQLKSDLDEAAVAFKSPEALKLAREKELGLHSTADIGIKVVISKLSAEAADFVPRSRSPAQEYVATQASKEQGELLVTNLKSLIENVLTQPGSFDELAAGFIGQVKFYIYSDDTVKEMTQIIFTKAIEEDNFKYLGARLCDKLTMPNVLPNFRSIFLNHFQGEFKIIRSLVDGKKEEDRPKIYGFFMFMAEVFIHVKVDGKPLTSFGKSLSKALENLLVDANPSNVTFVCKILKLAGARLLDAFEGNDVAMENYQKNFTILREYSEKHQDETDDQSKRIALLISSVSRLKETNWGRTMSNTRPKSDIDDPEQYGDELSEVDQNYYMNEPVFFTPDGVQYTAAEAQIPEFYEQHLAKYNLRPDVPFDETSSQSWSKSDGFDDYVASDDEEEFYKQRTVEDEYDNEFEKFLAESGQLS